MKLISIFLLTFASYGCDFKTQTSVGQFCIIDSSGTYNPCCKSIAETEFGVDLFDCTGDIGHIINASNIVERR